MRTFVKILVVLALLIALAWYVLDRMHPVSERHYRLDVTFEVDGVPVTGSGVQKLIVRRVRGLSAKRAVWTASGDAVIVDLPGRGAVFVLVTTPTSDGTYTHGTKGRFDTLVSDACELKKKRGKRDWSEYVRSVGELTGSCAVPDNVVPLMVRFADEAEPGSIERVYPDTPETSLGPGVRFLGATVTVTDAPVTTGIGTRLTWLSKYPEPSLKPGRSTATPPFSQTIRHGYFRRPAR